MGYKIFAIGGEREALELSCDYPSHREGWDGRGLIAGQTKATLRLRWLQVGRRRETTKARGFVRNAPARSTGSRAVGPRQKQNW